MYKYLKDAEDGLTDIYRRLAAFPPPSSDDIQRDIADIVVLLYGLRRNGAANSGPAETQPHALVFATTISGKIAMSAKAA